MKNRSYTIAEKLLVVDYVKQNGKKRLKTSSTPGHRNQTKKSQKRKRLQGGGRPLTDKQFDDALCQWVKDQRMQYIRITRQMVISAVHLSCSRARDRSQRLMPCSATKCTYNGLGNRPMCRGIIRLSKSWPNSTKIGASMENTRRLSKALNSSYGNNELISPFLSIKPPTCDKKVFENDRPVHPTFKNWKTLNHVNFSWTKRQKLARLRISMFQSYNTAHIVRFFIDRGYIIISTMDVASVVDEWIEPAELAKFQKAYEEQSRRGNPSALAVFNYAYALIKSTKEDVKTGIFLLEGLLKRSEEDIPKRDYVYYLAVAHTRLKEYDRALDYINLLLSVETHNRQAAELKALIEKRMKRDGLLGITILGLGGVGAIVAGVVTAALLSRRGGN